MPGYESITDVGDRRRTRDGFIDPAGPAMYRAEGAKGGFGAAIHPTVGFHQVNRLFKLFTRKLGKSFRYLQ
jgi:hypothetical protein